MRTLPHAADFYVTGGTMSPDADSYVLRAADKELLRSVRAGELCYVLTSGQMGKSSLMARAAKELAGVGVQSVQVTLETICGSGEAPGPDRFLYRIAHAIHKALEITAELSDWWRARELLSASERFREFLVELLLDSCHCPVAVFIDEIDLTIGFKAADDFFAAMRACYDGRASKPDLKRLTFVLLGVATPSQITADRARQRFKFGRRIELADFTPREAASLARGFPGSQPVRRALLARVLHWTGGQPYLTQVLCRAIVARRAVGKSSRRTAKAALAAVVDDAVEELFLKSQAAVEESNLAWVRDRLTRSNQDRGAVLGTYKSILSRQAVEDKPASVIHTYLKLAGLVRVDRRRCLRVRNRIYERAFGLSWLQEEAARTRASLQRRGPVTSVRIFLSSPGDVVADRAQAREVLLGAARGAFVRGRVLIDVVSWDDPQASAQMDFRLTPQQAVNRSLPIPAECDLTVVLLWGRMGTPLTETKAEGTPYLSGTEWELENALSANRPVWLYRRSDKVLLDLDDNEFESKIAQMRHVIRFFKGLKGADGSIRRSHASYASTGELAARLRRDMDQFLEEVMRGTATDETAQQIDAHDAGNVGRHRVPQHEAGR